MHGNQNIGSKMAEAAAYRGVKKWEDVGYFLQAYIASGGVVTANPYRNNRVDVTEVAFSINDAVMSREATTFTTAVPNASYHLDVTKDGDWHWSTSHLAGTAGTDYLTIATVTTNSLGNVATITDTRGHVGGFILKDEYGLQNYATKAQLADIAVNVSKYKTGSNTWDDALSAAFTYLTTITVDNRGGIVNFPSGTFELSPFTMPCRVSVIGKGKGVTVLKQKAGTSGDLITFTTSSLFSQLRELTIDGNSPNCPTGANGVRLISKTTEGNTYNTLYDKTVETAQSYTYNIIDNVVVTRAKTNGFDIGSGYWGSVFTRIFAFQCGGHGIYNRTSDIFFNEIQTEANSLCGIYDVGSNNRWGNIKTIWNGKDDAVNSAGFKMVNGARELIENIEAQDNYCDGIMLVNSVSIQINNLLIDANGRIYGQPDPTDGSFAGNNQNCGLRLTNTNNSRIKGLATNYKFPNCYLQYVAVVCDSASVDYVVDVYEYRQYTPSTTIKNSPGGYENRFGMPDGTVYLAKPITDFPINTVVTQRIGNTSSSPYSTDYGDTRGGDLLTHRHDDDRFSYQEFIPYEVDVRYMRHWNTSGSAWGPWVIHSTQHIISGISNESGTVLTQPLTYFPLNSLYTICVNGGSANAPESAGGIYTVHRVKFANFSYAEFKIYNSEKRYERRWNTGTSTWNAWVLVQQVIT